MRKCIYKSSLFRRHIELGKYYSLNETASNNRPGNHTRDRNRDAIVKRSYELYTRRVSNVIHQLILIETIAFERARMFFSRRF